MKNFETFLTWFYQSIQSRGFMNYSIPQRIESINEVRHTLELIHARMICKEPQTGFITACCHGKWEEATKRADVINFANMGLYILFVDYCNMKLEELTKIK